MRKSQAFAFISEKCVKFQFPVNKFKFPCGHTPLDWIFYTYASIALFLFFNLYNFHGVEKEPKHHKPKIPTQKPATFHSMCMLAVALFPTNELPLLFLRFGDFSCNFQNPREANSRLRIFLISLVCVCIYVFIYSIM